MKKHLPADAVTVLVMRGRGNDELAPSKALFDDYKAAEAECRKSTSDATEAAWCAYEACDYERRFREQMLANPASMDRLKALTEESRDTDVFLICYEGEDKPCHRKVLLEIAQEELGADVDAGPFIP
jgi:uncharacterized protein YeaO (DUF488 family)